MDLCAQDRAYIWDVPSHTAPRVKVSFTYFQRVSEQGRQQGCFIVTEPQQKDLLKSVPALLTFEAETVSFYINEVEHPLAAYEADMVEPTPCSKVVLGLSALLKHVVYWIIFWRHLSASLIIQLVLTVQLLHWATEKDILWIMISIASPRNGIWPHLIKCSKRRAISLLVMETFSGWT